MLRNKLRYLMLLAALGLISILYNRYYMSILFLTVLVIPFLMFAVLSYIYGMVTAKLMSATHVVNKGEAIPVTILLNNASAFPVSNLKIYLTYYNSYSQERYKKEFLVSVDSRTKTAVTFNLFSEYAGNLIISVEAIRIYDYLKLFSFRRKLQEEIKTAVMPLYYELPEDDGSRHYKSQIESDTYSPYKSGDDPSEVFAIREYREGDHPQRIHWKLSRKQGQLMIKEFSDPMNCSVLLLINLCISSEEKVISFMDAILECAISLSYTFLMKGCLHYIAWFDIRHGGCRRVRVADEKDLYEAVDGLLQALPYEKSIDAAAAYLAEHPNELFTDLYCVAGEVSASGLDLLSMIKAQSRQIIYICDAENRIHSEKITEDIIHKTGDAGIHLCPVDVTNVKRDINQIKLNWKWW